jgi:hypothetical protein
MNFLLFAAEAATAPQTTQAPDGWMAMIVGPVGALALSVGWIIWTEKHRIPRFGKLVEELTAKLESAIASRDDLRDKQSINKDELRDKFDAREKELEKTLSDWRSRHTKEKALRVYWEALARQKYKAAGEDAPEPPKDAGTTLYGE